MIKISAIIPTYNEEAHIEAAISSVSWADEIIVVDSFSTDQTATLVESHENVRLVQHEYENSAAQKNWIIPQAKYDWVFVLDADERVTTELKNEIVGIQKASGQPVESAYLIRRQNFFLGQKLNFVWKGDTVIRLFNRTNSKYQDLAVHSEVITQGKLGRLKGKLEHHTVLTMQRYLEKMERYAEWSAKDHFDKTPRVGLFHLYVKPAFRFFKHYVLEGGILDGYTGYTVSQLMAKGVKRRYEIIKEMRNRKS